MAQTLDFVKSQNMKMKIKFAVWSFNVERDDVGCFTENEPIDCALGVIAC